ncbi:MFS-type transporter SLC18B1-like [Haliotis asinina]|uniref:MFS-type transporter SLC18B1-like n=1 Tax=Haliotis asinina TaxID=109174 RepID=UPI0035327AA8
MTDSVKTEDSPKAMGSTRKKLALAVVVMSNFCAMCCISLIAPFYTVEAGKKGVSLTLVGIIYSSSEFITLATSPIFGYLLSKYNPRTFYIVGLCLFGGCDVIFGCLDLVPSGTPYIVACFSVRSLEAIGTSSVLNASFTIAGLFFPERIATVFGMLKTASGTALMFGPAIGGILYQLGGYGLPFWVLGSCTFVCGCASCLLLPRQEQEFAPSVESPSCHKLLRSVSVWFAFFSNFASKFAIGCFVPFYAAHLLQFNLNQGTIGLVFMVLPGAYTISTLVCGYLFDHKVPAAPSICAGLCSLSISFILIGPAPFLSFVPTMLWLTILVTFFIGLSIAPILVGSMKYIFEEARNMGFMDDGGLIGPLSAIVQCAVSSGNFIGPIVGGALVEHFGFPWAMTISSIPAVIMLADHMHLSKPVPSQPILSLHGIRVASVLQRDRGGSWNVLQNKLTIHIQMHSEQ